MPGFDEELSDALRNSAAAVDGDGAFERVKAKRARRRRNRHVVIPGAAATLAAALLVGIALGAEDPGLRVDTRSRRPAALHEATTTIPDATSTTLVDKSTTVDPANPGGGQFRSESEGPCEPGNAPGLRIGAMDDMGLAMVDPSRAWVATGPDIFATSDGGQTWVHQAHCAALFQDLAMLDGSRGWALGNDNLALTADGGRTWTMQTLPPTNKRGPLHWLTLAVVDAQHAWIGGSFNELATTDDGGQTWRIITTSNGMHRRMSFADTLNGWVGVEAGDMQGGGVRRTRDGGVSWTPVNLEPEGGQAVFFLDSSTGWAARGTGVSSIARTDDGGRTWKTGRMPLDDAYWSDVFFVDKEHGWAVGNTKGGTIIAATIDGGATWHRQGEGLTYSGEGFSDFPAVGHDRVRFADADHGLVGGRGQGIWRTSDGGKTWQ